MFNNFYRNKRIFITGHTGFKGAWLTLWLKRLGAEIFGYSLARIEEIANGTEADIRDYSRLKQAIETCRPDIIFHLAAQPWCAGPTMTPTVAECPKRVPTQSVGTRKDGNELLA